METMLLSVIIPAYHSEKTITEAVKSICREFQKIPFEIIIVENGTKDSIRQMTSLLSSYAHFIRFSHSEKGVSNARNHGLNQALGKWVMFVDADDALHKGCGKRLIEIMQTDDADLCLFGHQSGRKIKTPGNETMRYTWHEIEAARIRMLKAPTRYMQVWGKIFKRQRILESGVSFEPNLYVAEDSDFTFQYTEFCRSIVFYPDIIYDYHINHASVMHTFDEKKVPGYTQAMQVMQKRLAEASSGIQSAGWQYTLTHFHIAMVNGVFCPGNNKSFLKKVGQVRQTARHPVFQKAIRYVSLTSCGWIERVTGWLLKGHLYGLLGVVYTIRAWQKRRV